jgi:hypothetical protein
LATDGLLYGGLVGRIHLEGIGDARLGDLNRFGVVGGEGAILQAGAEEVDDSQRKALVGFGGGLPAVHS